MPENSKFYLTTPIYYVNARPHIGHAYSTIAADVLARRHRLLGEDTFFLTGTDEHGQKVQRSAEAAGIPPQQFADEVSATFQNLWKRMGITNDDYIRTTDERHKKGVQHLWKELEKRSAIYLSSYTGQYCVSDEAFVDVPVGAPCPTCGRITETITEENYFFRLSDFQRPLLELIESGTLHVQPETARNEVLSFIRGNTSEVSRTDPAQLAYSSRGIAYVPGALKDLSISRTTFNWGIKVPPPEGVILSEAKDPGSSGAHQPSEPNHVIYVWLDALANYITAIGYGSDDPADQAKFAKYWPADIHLVGKEITRFHCVYWPAFLMAAGIPTPKSVVANGWLLFEESKMSKSRGNVVRTETILDAFGPLCPSVPVATDASVAPASEVVILSEAKNPRSSPEAPQPLTAPTKAQQDLFAADVIRYFLLREIPFGQDGSFSFDALITRYNADLANGYGNLVSRTLNMIVQFNDSTIPASERSDVKNVFWDSWSTIFKKQLSFGHFDFATELSFIERQVKAVDSLITTWAPWKLVKSQAETDHGYARDCLYTAAESIRIITALLYPILPYATAKVWAQLGLGDIEESARKGELKNLQWGGLKPGTKLGPLAPIFPRADKGLAQIMTDMEAPATPAATTPEVATAVPAVAAPATENETTDNAAAPQAQPISIDDFVKIDLRVARIVVAERIPKADKLLRLEVDLGYEKRQILSGIAEWYTPEELIGRRIAIIANLAPRKMRGLESHGMLLAASGEDHSSKPILASFSDEIALGSKIR